MAETIMHCKDICPFIQKHPIQVYGDGIHWSITREVRVLNRDIGITSVGEYGGSLSVFMRTILVAGNVNALCGIPKLIENLLDDNSAMAMREADEHNCPVLHKPVQFVAQKSDLYD